MESGGHWGALCEYLSSYGCIFSLLEILLAYYNARDTFPCASAAAAYS